MRSRGLFERPLARWRLRREFRRAARESRAPVRSRFAGSVAGPFRDWSARPRGPLFRGKLDRNLALIAIVVLGGGVAALALLSGTPAPASLGRVGANPATPVAVPVLTPTPKPTPAPSVPASPKKHHASKPAASRSTKAGHRTPAPVTSTVPAPPPQTNPPNPSPHPTTQPPKPTPTNTPSPSPPSSPPPTSPPSPTPTPSLTTPPIPG